MCGDSTQQLRNQVYDLLYAHPLTDYAQGQEIRAAIIGGGDIAVEAFKAVYSCGQALYQDGEEILAYRLILDLFPASDSGFDEQYLRNNMPGMADFPDYAQITFHRNRPEALDGYVALLCGEEGEAPGVPALEAKWTEQGFLVRKGGEYAALSPSVRQDILRMEKNTQYIYRLLEDRYALYDSIDEEESYSSDSSSAAIAHLPCRLALLDKDPTQAARKLEELLNLPFGRRGADKRYQAMIRLEHRRWNAYMAANGRRAPSLDEFYGYAYTSRTATGDHKDLERGLHPCICEGGDDPFYLQRHPELWETRKVEEDSALSPLDRLSIRCHRLCMDKARRLRPKLLSVLGGFKTQTMGDKAAGQFCAAVEKAASFEFSALSLYKKCLNRLSEEIRRTHREKLDDISHMLEVFRRAGEKKDFARIDVQLTDALPMILRHGKLYRTVITVCGSQLMEAVALPYMLSCERAVFLCGGTTDVEKLRRFFSHRATDIKAEFVQADLGGIDAIEEAVAACIPENVRQDEIVLNCTDISRSDVILAMGRMCGRNGRLALLRYDREIVDCKTNRVVSCAVKKSMPVDDYLQLMSAEYENAYSRVDMLAEYEDLVDIFRTYSQIRTCEKSKGGVTKYCTWSALAGFFGSISRNTELPDFLGTELLRQIQNEDRSCGGQVCDLRIDKTVYQNFGLELLLKRMRQYRLIDISDADIRPGEDYVSISFRTPDSSTRQIFRGIGRWTADVSPARKHIAVTGNILDRDPICMLDSRAPRSALFNPDDKEDMKREKLQLLEELYSREVITDLDSDGILTQRLAPHGDPSNRAEVTQCSFAFSSVQIKRLFQKTGQLFELILFNKLQEYRDLFSDVQTEVKIAWSDDRSWDYLDRLNSYFRENEGVGKAYFNRAREAVRASGGCYTENEIDVVLMSDLQPTFISCKTGKGIENSWLYEIASVAGHFSAQPALAVSFDLEEQMESVLSYVKRAKRMRISLFGSETIYNEQRLRASMEQIARGEVVSVLTEG